MDKLKVGVVLTTMNFKWTDISLPDLVTNTRYPYNLYLIDDETTDASRKKLDMHFHNTIAHWTCVTGPFCVREIKKSYTDGSRVGIPNSWNRGVKAALEDNCDYIMVLNNDICFPDVPPVSEKDWLEKLVDWMEANPDHGWLSPSWFWTGEFDKEDGARKFKESCAGYVNAHKDETEDGGFACFMLMRSAMIRDMMEREKDKPLLPGMDNEPCPGLFDERHFKVCWEDVSYCTQLRYHGWRNKVIHSVALGHKGSGTTGSEEWGKVIKGEYNQGHINFCHKFRIPGPHQIDYFRVSCCVYEFVYKGEFVRWDKDKDLTNDIWWYDRKAGIQKLSIPEFREKYGLFNGGVKLLCDV